MSSDLAVLETAPAPNLLGASSPSEVIALAQAMAQPLGDLIRDQKMVTRIGRNEHTNIEGWQTAGAMLGISAQTTWSRPVTNLPEGQRGWEARAEARTRAGELIGAAEGMVTTAERNWKHGTDQSLRSMAQTRAQSKALSGALRWVMSLTGVSGTPVEEVPDTEPEPDGAAGMPSWTRPCDPNEFVKTLETVLRETQVADPKAAANKVAKDLYEAMGGRIPIVAWGAVSLVLDQIAIDRNERTATAEEYDAEVPSEAAEATEAVEVAQDTPEDPEALSEDESVEDTTATEED